MSEPIFTFPAQIIDGAPSLERLAESLRGIEDADNLFVFTAEISNDNLDYYYTRMAESSLRNFAQDATAGVALLDSHSIRNLGYGRSLVGRFEREDGRMRVLADFYTVPGIRFGGGQSYESTDDFIKAVRAQIAKDMSIGFGGGETICDICGEPVWGWRTDCPHIPGLEYPVGERGEQTVLATGTNEDERLFEASVVYAAATPDAMILKIEREADAGRLVPEQARLLEVRYRVKLPGVKHNWPGLELGNGRKQAGQGEGSMDVFEQERLEIAESDERPLANALRQALTNAGIKTQNHEVVGCIRRLGTELSQLRSLADDGRQYRTDLIEEALAEGVRAHGDEFAQETYRGMLEQSSIEVIKRMRDDWKAIGDKRFLGGRQTEDGDPSAGADDVPVTADDVPITAYKN